MTPQFGPADEIKTLTLTVQIIMIFAQNTINISYEYQWREGVGQSLNSDVLKHIIITVINFA